ncbi:MAG: hypothetical protein AAF688_07020 [Bacteroidota bacterium]
MGSIGSMNASIKNNRNVLNANSRRTFGSTLSVKSESIGYTRNEMPLIFPHQLKRVRRKIQKQNRRVFRLKVVIGIIVLPLLVYIFYRLNN